MTLLKGRETFKQRWPGLKNETCFEPSSLGFKLAKWLTGHASVSSLLGLSQWAVMLRHRQIASSNMG